MPPKSENLQLRAEQLDAISQTFTYWQHYHGHNEKFLWNAKPRFGKTLASYYFAQKIQARRILIITHRPAIADAWAKDFFRYIAPHVDYIFATPNGGDLVFDEYSMVSKNNDKTPDEQKYHIYSRHEIMHDVKLLERPLIFFMSLQDLKGRDLKSGNFKRKNQWVFDIQKRWDLVIIDEGHEGIKTDKSSQVFISLPANFTLYLSGTPFRALADQDFSSQQIYNWTYVDEQAAKAKWSAKSNPKNNRNSDSTNMLTLENPYAALPRLNFLTYSLAQLFHDEPMSDLYYDFGEFFRTANHKFVHEDVVKKWLDQVALIFAQREFWPNSQQLPISEADLRHSLWLLSGVAECLAMSELLGAHPYFSQFKIVVATGKDSASKGKHLDQVRAAIGQNPLQSRTITLSCGQLSTGVTVPEWSTVVMLYNVNNLNQASATQYLQAAFRAQNPWTFQNHQKQNSVILDFLPDRALIILQKYACDLCCQYKSSEKAIHELLQYLNIFDLQNRQMQKLNALNVLEMPQKIIAQEIVDGGFIASNKLFNIDDIFHMSKRAQRIISKFNAIHKRRLEKTPQTLSAPTIDLDANKNALPNLAIIRESYDEIIKNKKITFLKKPEKQKISNYLLILISKNAQIDPKVILKNCPKKNQEQICDAIREIQLLAQKTARKHRRREENDYRDKLRGLARIIPIFLHMYGQPNIKIRELIAKTPDEIFQNLSGITKSEFQIIQQEGYLNEINCNLAIREFMERKKDLSCYFLSSQQQSIFDFIPAQQNHYVFTPQKVAQKMVTDLERQNPQIFQSTTSAFFDPFAKSGLFLAMIIKKLFTNLRPQFRNDHDCLLHILSQQIYSWSPDPITHRLVQNTLLDFTQNPEFYFTKAEIELCKQNFLEYNPIVEVGGIDVAAARLQIIQDWSVDMKFDVIMSNPPYQYGRRQIYADFYRLAIDLDPELLCMIFPLGWQKTNNHNGLGQLNNAFYKRDPHIVSIDHYYETGDDKIFPDIGTGGVNIILRDRNYNNGGQIQKLEYGKKVGAMILPIDSSEVIKPAELTCLIERFQYLPKIDALGTSRKPYGFYADPLRKPEKYNLQLFDHPNQNADVRLCGLITSDDRGYKYIKRADLPKISPNLDHYKLFVPKAWGNMSDHVGLGGSYANICVAAPGDACTETFIEFGHFQNQQETIKMAKYFLTKFFRALLFLAKTSQNTTKDKYKYIPVPDLSLDFWDENISTLDQQLFELYDVPMETQEFILKNIQERSEANIEIL